LTPARPLRLSLRSGTYTFRQPEGLGLRGADVHTEHFAPAVSVDGHRDGHGDRDDPPVLTDLDVGGVDPKIGPVPFDGPGEEGVHPPVDLFAQPTDLALGNAGHAHGLDQIVHRAGRDALDVGFLDHRRQRLLRHPARLQKAGKIAAFAQLRDTQLHSPGPGLPVALAVAVVRCARRSAERSPWPAPVSA
jgi:hypothetical protein